MRADPDFTLQDFISYRSVLKYFNTERRPPDAGNGSGCPHCRDITLPQFFKTEKNSPLTNTHIKVHRAALCMPQDTGNHQRRIRTDPDFRCIVNNHIGKGTIPGYDTIPMKKFCSRVNRKGLITPVKLHIAIGKGAEGTAGLMRGKRHKPEHRDNNCRCRSSGQGRKRIPHGK